MHIVIVFNILMMRITTRISFLFIITIGITAVDRLKFLRIDRNIQVFLIVSFITMFSGFYKFTWFLTSRTS